MRNNHEQEGIEEVREAIHKNGRADFWRLIAELALLSLVGYMQITQGRETDAIRKDMYQIAQTFADHSNRQTLHEQSDAADKARIESEVQWMKRQIDECCAWRRVK